ncbi:ATPase, partial [Spiromyces aspiralis]
MSELALRREWQRETNLTTVDATRLLGAPCPRTPLEAYEHSVQSGHFTADQSQRTVINFLERLHGQLKDYAPMPRRTAHTQGLLSKLWSWPGSSKEDPYPADTPLGLYIYGGVGTGKTTVMDLFYHTLDTPRKHRSHFHTFMLNIHSRIQQLRQQVSQSYDPIPKVAQDLASEAHVLCFDEFQVTDIADAMILRNLVSEMFKNGMVIVATSNRHPDELYQNGIQRDSFIPCIKLLKERCQ